jgi:uncharacterized protein (TIGR03083 family)
MTSAADRTISALRSGHDDLVAFLATLGPDDITRTSAAAEWTVAQVLSHLGSGAEITLARLEGALNGTGQDPEFNKSVWARWDAMSPAEQAATFPATNEKLLRRYEGLDERTRAELRIDLGFLPAPVEVATAAGLRLNEFTLHTWDVKATFDPTATLAREATEPLLDAVRALVGFLGKADRIDGPVSVAVHATDLDRSYGLVIGDAVALTDGVDSPNAELTAPAEYVLRLITGRHGAAYTPASVEVSGAVTLDDLRRVFPGF